MSYDTTMMHSSKIASLSETYVCHTNTVVASQQQLDPDSSCNRVGTSTVLGNYKFDEDMMTDGKKK